MVFTASEEDRLVEGLQVQRFDLRSKAIKGPGLRLKLDVRRVWECPACGRRVKRGGEVTNYKCPCREPALWMRLIENQRFVREYQPYIVPEITADDLAGDEEPAASEPAIAEEAVLVEVEVIEPAEVESPLEDDDEFFSPEDRAEDNPPLIEPPASEPEPSVRLEPLLAEPASEPSAAEPEPEPAVPSDRPPESPPKDQPRPGKSRRRSGRKRRRRHR